MNSRTDQQLLSDYTERRSEAAFAELVRRHIDFVYSAALRMVRDTHLAEDVAQSVFVTVAQNARQLVDCTILPGWLHRTTQNLAANAVRSDVRRRAGEQEAAVMNDLLSAIPDAGWEHIAPHLDEALGQLDDTDRDAVLLRYFKNHDLRTVGATLGISDDAAQKRVSRAVERLREFFARRGVTVGASGLAVSISVNAVQAAPVGLAVTISTAAAALAGTTLAVTATATKVIAMTTLQKTIATATVAVLAGAGIYEARQASQLRDQNQMLQQQRAPLADRVEQLTKDRADVASKLAALRDENERLSSNTAEVLMLRGELGRLRKQLERATQPVADATSASISLQAPTNQKEFENMQHQMSTALQRIGFALRQFMTNHPFGLILDDSGQVNAQIFSNSPALPLDHVQILARDVQHFANAIEQYPKAVIAKSRTPIPFDDKWTRFYLLADNSVSAITLPLPDEQLKAGHSLPSVEELKALAEAQDPVRTVLRPALEAFAAANNGRRPTDPSQLQPYITTPEQQAVLNKEIGRRNSAGAPK